MPDYGATDTGGQRDRITQALLDIQSPPPRPDVQQMQGGMPGMQAPMGGMQQPPPPTGGMPPAAVGTPGVPGMLAPQLGSAVPGMMQPGGMLAPPPPPGGAPPMPGAMPQY